MDEVKDLVRFRTTLFEDVESNFHEVKIEFINEECFLTYGLRHIGRFYQLTGRINLLLSCRGSNWDISIFYQLDAEIDYPP